ncbi:MAG: hypothetical protein ACTTKH_02700 [Treponema sp.]
MKKFVSIRYKMIAWILFCVIFLTLIICVILGFQTQASTLENYNRFILQQVLTINKTLSLFSSDSENIVKTLSKQRILRISNASNVSNNYNGNGFADLSDEGKLIMKLCKTYLLLY